VTALLAVADYLPQHRVPIEEPAERLGLTAMQVKIFRRYHGLGEVARDPHGTLLDLLRGAVALLHPLREFGIGHAAVFAVGHHACASGLLAVDIAGRLLDADGDDEGLALVLTGEKTFTREARLVPETSFFGEGAAACLVSASGERDRLLSYATDLRGEFDTDAKEAALEFQRVYAASLAETILAAVARAGLTMDTIGLILPHNVNRVAWRQVCRTLGYPRERVVLDNVASVGHVFCADTFINYRTALRRGLLHRGEPYVMAAAGAGRGATFSAMVLVH
jgi:3-oxoacyl-[acyl-carrier-protein] synthase-3